MASDSGSYRYALLGIIGLVALVAIFIIIRPVDVLQNAANVRGNAVADDVQSATQSAIDTATNTVTAISSGAGGAGGSVGGSGGAGVGSTGTVSSTCGSRDMQTFFCGGANACCGGDCVALPDCTGKPNGPVFTCGVRQMYCCNGNLSLVQQCMRAPVVDPVILPPSSGNAPAANAGVQQ